MLSQGARTESVLFNDFENFKITTLTTLFFVPLGEFLAQSELIQPEACVKNHETYITIISSNKKQFI